MQNGFKAEEKAWLLRSLQYIYSESNVKDEESKK